MRTAALIGALVLAVVGSTLCDDNPPPIGELEIPEHLSTVFDVVSVCGWVLDFEDAQVTVTVFVDGAQVGTASYPAGNRPDIQAAYPEVPHSLQTGFGYALNTKLYPNGSHRIRVVAADPQGESAVIGEAEVTIMNSGTPQPRPWPDTSNGIYVFNDQIADYITGAQTFFAATHYSGCQKVIRFFADSLRIHNPNFLILHYRLGLGLGYRAPDGQGQPTGEWLRIIEGNNWVREWPDNPQDQWFFPYDSSPKVYQNQWGWYLIDPDNASWRSYWLAEVLRQIQTNDDDGLFADSFSVPNFMGGYSFTPNLPSYDPTFETAWSGRIERWIAAIKQDFGSQYRLIPNVGAWVTTRDVTNYTGADGAMIEGFCGWGQSSPFELVDWQLQMNRILSLARIGKIVIAQAYVDSPSDIAYRKFLLGSYLLVKGSKSFINMELAMEPEWFPEYGIDLGAPLDALPSDINSFYRADWGVYAREYAKGFTLVNPRDTPRTFSVGSGYKRVTPVGGGIVPADGDISERRLAYEPVTSVTVLPYSSEILVAEGSGPAHTHRRSQQRLQRTWASRRAVLPNKRELHAGQHRRTAAQLDRGPPAIIELAHAERHVRDSGFRGADRSHRISDIGRQCARPGHLQRHRRYHEHHERHWQHHEGGSASGHRFAGYGFHRGHTDRGSRFVRASRGTVLAERKDIFGTQPRLGRGSVLSHS